MSDISQIKVKGVTYDVKDAHSRSLLETYEPIIQDYQENGARTDGYYETMGVGVASNVKGSVDEDTDFLYRKTGGDKAENILSGNASITSLKGNSVRFFQKMQHPIFEKIGTNDVTYSNGIYTLHGSQTAFGNITIIPHSQIQSGHVYFFGYKSEDSIFGVGVSQYEDGGIERRYEYVTSLGEIFTSEEIYDIIIVGSRRNPDGKKFSFSFFDLTEIFGAGNEPSSTVEFEAMFPTDFPNNYYSFESIVNSNVVGIKTIGFNQFDLSSGKIKVFKGVRYQITGTYTSLTLDNTRIYPNSSNGLFIPHKNGELIIEGGSSNTCVHFSDSSKNGTYEPYWEGYLPLNINTITGKLDGSGESIVVFPNGMAGMNGVQDTIVGNVATKKFTQIGSLNTLDIALNYEGYEEEEGEGNLRYSFNVRLPKKGKDFTLNALFSSVYKVSNNIDYNSSNNFCIKEDSNGGYIEIMDDDFAEDARFADEEQWDALIADIQESLSDKVLLYELSNYEQYVLDSFSLPINYKVDSKGIESIHVYGNNGNGIPCQMTINYLLDIQNTVKHSVSYLPTSGVTEEQKQNARKNIGLEEFVKSINGQTGVVTQLAHVIDLYYYAVVKDAQTGEFNSYYSVNLASYEDDYVAIYEKILRDRYSVGVVLAYEDEEQNENNTFQNLRINAPYYSGEIGFNIIFNDGTKDVTIRIYYPDDDPGGGSGS